MVVPWKQPGAAPRMENGRRCILLNLQRIAEAVLVHLRLVCACGEKYKIQNTKYTCDTGQTRNKLLEQWVHLTNHTAGHSRPGTTHQTA